MNSLNLSAIKDALHTEQKSLTASAEKLRTELDAVEADKARIDAAIAALDGSKFAAPGKRKTANSKAKPTIAAAGKYEVMKYMETILQAESVLLEKELKERVEALAQKDGYTRLGIGLRIKEAITTPRFANTDSGIRLSLLGSET